MTSPRNTYATAKLLLLCTVLCLVPAVLRAEPPTNFDNAKDAAVSLWWEIGPATFYCGCPYREATPEEKKIRSGNLWVIGSVCGYQAKDATTSKGKPNARSMRIEWEHIVPADWIATGFGCRDQTRSECRAIPGYDQAEGDLFNLVPSVGELNGDRSSKLYGIIDGEPREYGACDFEVADVAEPKEAVRGDVARVWLYMADKYGVTLSADYRAMLEGWSAADPVSEAERRRHDVIANEMGWGNRFITEQ
tara:strand:+ start:6299 stop:7045 length:747 start_codon:yes stop_codon:yes gene_type:complete